MLWKWIADVIRKYTIKKQNYIDKSQSKDQAQIQEGKREFGLWAVS